MFFTIQKSAERRIITVMKQAMKELVRMEAHKYVIKADSLNAVWRTTTMVLEGRPNFCWTILSGESDMATVLVLLGRSMSGSVEDKGV